VRAAKRCPGGLVGSVARTGELALSWGVQGDDAPRLLIPLVRIEDADGGDGGDAEDAEDARTGEYAEDAARGSGVGRHRAEPAGRHAREEQQDRAADMPGDGPGDAVADWAGLAGRSADLVVVLDVGGRVCAVSSAAAELVGDPDPANTVGRHLLDVLDLVDFNPMPGDASMYADRIPPLLALASNALSRGLLRIRTAGRTETLDAIAAPLHDSSGALVGAVAFLARLGG
jgi:PAS domain-containing protein